MNSTLLYLAAYGNCPEAIGALVMRLGDTINLNLQTEPHGGTALHGMS